MTSENSIQKGETYVTALRKHIPAGLLTVYLATNGIVEAIPIVSVQTIVCWIVFVLCLIALPLWMRFYDENRSTMQIVFAMVSYVILVFTTGGPLEKHITNPDVIATVKLIAAATAAIFTGVVAPIVAKLNGP